MPWFLQMLSFGLFLIGIAFALWVGFWVLLLLFGLATGYALWTYVRDYLIEKGILNPKPGVPPQDPAGPMNVTIVDGDFTRVENGESEKIEG